MTMKAVFSYANPDATTDMNAHFRILFKKGIVSGGLITPVGGTYQVTVSAFTAVSYDGMVVEQDADTTLTIPSSTKGTTYYVVLVAQYNAPASPTLQLQVMSSTTYSASTTDYLIVLGSVTLATTSTSVLNNNISYVHRDVTTKVGYLNIQGSISMNDTPPNTGNRSGDLYVIYDSTPPYFLVWNGSEWTKFTDYSSLAEEYEVHVTDNGAFTGTTATTDARHVTKSMKAALAGTAGTPSATNLFVTQADTALLSPDEQAALNGAVGGTLTANNPVVSKNLAILEERVVAYAAATGGQASAQIAATISGTTVSVFVGTRGIESDLNGNSVSTARQFFRVEDAFGKGLVINNAAIYITDVKINSTSFDTQAASNVSESGFWDGTGTLSVVFNAAIPAGTVFYVRYNIQGTVASLSPANRGTGASGRYAIPATGYKNSINSFIESYSVLANTISTAQINITGQAFAAKGTPSAPSYTFTTDSTTGLFYVGTTSNSALVDYDGIGFAVSGSTLLVMGKAAPTVDMSGAYHMLEADVDSNGYPYHKWALVTSSSSGSRPLGSFMFGTANYLSDFTPAFGILWQASRAQTFNKAQPYMSIQRDVAIEAPGSTDTYQLSVMGGTASAPGIVFNRSQSGFYYFDTLGDTVHSMYKGIAVAINGSPLVVMGNNSASISGSAYATQYLMIEKSDDSDIRLGMFGYQTTGALHLGYSNYLSDWIDQIVLGNDIRVYDDLVSTKNITAAMVSGTSSVRAPAHIATTDGTTSSPAFTFTSNPSWGMYLAGAIQNNDLILGTRLTLAVNGYDHLALGRDSWFSYALAPIAPLEINSYAQGSNAEFGYNIAIPFTQSNTGKHEIRFGSSYYNSDFDEDFTLVTYGSGQASELHAYCTFHIEHGSSFYMHTGVGTGHDDLISRVDCLYSSILNDRYFTIDSCVNATDKLYVTARSSGATAELILGTGNLYTTNFFRTNSTIIKDWYQTKVNSSSSMLDVSGAWNGTATGTPSLSSVATALQNLIAMLGYNTTNAAESTLHTLFPYTH